MPPKVSVSGGAAAPVKHGLCLFVVQGKNSILILTRKMFCDSPEFLTIDFDRFLLPSIETSLILLLKGHYRKIEISQFPPKKVFLALWNMLPPGKL